MNKELEPLGGVDAPTFNSLWHWVKELFNHNLFKSDIEAYLGQSTDHADLEHRINTLQRKGLL